MMRRLAKNESGAALVEFAIVLPFLLMILYAVISWGYSLAMTDAMYDAAREGAREMSVGESDEEQASATVLARLGAWSGQFDVLAEDTATTGTDRVVVTVTSDNVFDGLLPFVGSLPPLVAQVTMRKES